MELEKYHDKLTLLRTSHPNLFQAFPHSFSISTSRQRLIERIKNRRLETPENVIMGSSEMAATPCATVSGQTEPERESASPDVPADIRGPSPEQWERHKRTIIDMYGTMKLKDIRERMAHEYGFHATYVVPLHPVHLS
jgi:hypothetical protein